MFIAFFECAIPDRCGAFFSDLCLARELRRRGHSVILIDCGRTRNFAGGEYEGFRWKPAVTAGKELDQTHVWISPHSPHGPTVRRLNASYRRPIIFTLHFGAAKNMFYSPVPISWPEYFWHVNEGIPKKLLNDVWPSQVVGHSKQYPFVESAPARIESNTREYITLINANMDKGLEIFLKIAKALPDHKFLAIRSYYHPPTNPYLEVPPNIIWEDFTRDTKSIYERTRILLVPSLYESFCMVAVEALMNGIPVIYTRPYETDKFNYQDTTKGIEEWIGDAAIQAGHDAVHEWTGAIQVLDDPDIYTEFSSRGPRQVEPLLDTAPQGADFVEKFARENPTRTGQLTGIRAEPLKPTQQGPAPQLTLTRPSQPPAWRNGRLTFGRR